MDIDKWLAVKILKYLYDHKEFYFPFRIVCEKCPPGSDFTDIEPEEWEKVSINDSYEKFQLHEDLQNLDNDTTELMAKGFIETITNQSLEKHVYALAKNYRKQWQRDLCESEKIEEYGLNEFIGGKVDAFEDCLYLIRKYSGLPDSENLIFIEYEDK